MYEFENDDMIDFEGVELQGYVESTYDELVDIFGDPTIGDDMTDAKWVLQFKMPLDEEGYSEDCEYVTATIHKEDDPGHTKCQSSRPWPGCVARETRHPTRRQTPWRPWRRGCLPPSGRLR